jgi:hypothetical protein
MLVQLAGGRALCRSQRPSACRPAPGLFSGLSPCEDALIFQKALKEKRGFVPKGKQMETDITQFGKYLNALGV